MAKYEDQQFMRGGVEFLVRNFPPFTAANSGWPTSV